MSRWLPLMENFDILRDAYQGQYNDGSRLVKSMEADGIAILTKEDELFYPLYFENIEEFLDRLERSKKAGRNLFYEEWEKFGEIPGAIY